MARLGRWNEDRIIFWNARSATLPAHDHRGTALRGARLGTNAVATAAIVAQGVTRAKIQNQAVSSAKIGTSAVVAQRIAANAVTRVKVINQAIGSAKIGTAAVRFRNVGASQVGTTRISDGGVTFRKVGLSAVGTTRIADAGLIGRKVGIGMVRHTDVNHRPVMAYVDNTVVRATSGNTVWFGGATGVTRIINVIIDQRHRISASAVTATYVDGTATLQLLAGSIQVNTVGVVVWGIE